MIRALVAVLAAVSFGCAGAASAPYSPQDLQQRCVQSGGWWRADVGSGYCERV